MLKFENQCSKQSLDLWGTAPWRMLHKSLRYKIEMFHNLEPPCCVRWPTNLTDLMHHYKPEEQGPNVGKTNCGGTWHVPSPCLLCLCLLTAYTLEILVKHDSGQDLWFIMCPLWNSDILCVSSENHNQHFFLMKKDRTEIRRHHIYVTVLWRLSQDVSPPLTPSPFRPTHTVWQWKISFLLWTVDKSLKNTSLDNFY